MGLEEIFEPFQEAMGGEAVCRFGGPATVDANLPPPRISWEPLAAKHTASTRVTGAAGDDGPFSTRQWAIQVKVYAKTLDQLEELADLFLSQARQLLSKFSFSPGDEVWKTGGVTAGQMVAELIVFISRPVLKKPVPVKRITGIDAAHDMGGTPTVTVNIRGS